MITHTEVRDLIGAELLDSSGTKVGRIGQIYLDESTGEPEWATVNTSRSESCTSTMGWTTPASAPTAGSPVGRPLPSNPEGGRRQSAGRPATTPPAGTPMTR